MRAAGSGMFLAARPKESVRPSPLQIPEKPLSGGSMKYQVIGGQATQKWHS